MSASVVPIVLSAPPAGAAPTDPTALSIGEITGTRVARGAGPATVSAVVRNAAAEAAAGVTVRYQLPTGIEFVASASSAGCSAAATLVTCSLGTLAGGSTTPVAIGVREPIGAAVLGTRTGYFLPPTSDAFDPGAGEILQTTWFHEAGREGSPLTDCWPVELPTPNMDVAGGACDGQADAPALTADDTQVLDAFPGPFAQSVVRSWQFETEIAAPATGSYRACGVLLDDGGYLAIVEAGQTATSAAIVAATAAYGSNTSAPFQLEGGRRYRVLMRVSNRGDEGVDNGADGGTLAGWTAFGLAPADQPCGIADAAVFGNGDQAWVQRQAADVIVVGASNVRVMGVVQSAPVAGRRQAAVRLVNTGADATTARLSVRLPAGATLTTPLDGCDQVPADAPTTCEFSDLPAADPAVPGRLVSLAYTGGGPELGWSVTALSAVDTDATDDVTT